MPKTYQHLPLGYAMTIVTDATSSGLYVQQTPGVINTPVPFSASSTVVVGPFNDARSYEIAYTGNAPTVSTAQSGVFTGSDDDTLQTQIDSKMPLIVTSNVGVAETGVTVVERGDGYNHTSILTVDSVLPAIAGGAALSVGTLLYTLPAGALVINSAYMSMAITQSEDNITADTPDIGLGTVVAAGANALLSDTSGAENILTGQTANDCDGTAEVKTVADQILVVASGDSHGVYFNVADTWAADGDAAATISGTVVLNWSFMA